MTETEILTVLVDNRHELRSLIRRIGDATLTINGESYPAQDVLKIGELTLSEWLPLLDASARTRIQSNSDTTSQKGESNIPSLSSIVELWG